MCKGNQTIGYVEIIFSTNEIVSVKYDVWVYSDEIPIPSWHVYTDNIVQYMSYTTMTISYV
jgi:hypothetical protein